MKRKDLLSALIDTGLAFFVAIAGVGCLVSGFQLDADMEIVAWTALLFAFLGAVSVRLRWGWILPVLAALGGIFLLRYLDFSYNFYSLLNRILSLYQRGYGWEVPEFISLCDDWDLTLSIQTIVACCALFAGIYLSHCLHPLASLAVLLPVVPCILLTDTVPSAEYLLLAILLMALLALTQHARHTNTRQANRLTALLLIPVLLSGMLLFQHNPKSEYEPLDISKEMFQLMEQLAEHIPFLNQTPNPDVPITDVADSVQLNAAGPRPQINTRIMEVVASRSGALYLRGRSYTEYTGLCWEAQRILQVMELPGEDYLDASQTIQIQALQDLSIRYFPYYTGNVTLDGGALEGKPEEIYLLRYAPLRADWKYLWRKEHGVLGVQNSVYAEMKGYIQLPASTAEGALQHLKEACVNTHAGILQIADTIADYVRSSAKYDLNTNRMPTPQPDFALWFLNESQTGYCIHFASAATVLLRAAGIPARYVEGYLVDAVAGQPTVVYGKNAHAWVEYYVPELGWVVLEATPSDGLPIVLPTEPTEPDPTTKPTEPTEPTEPTDPTEPTGPTKPTTPTEPTEPTDPTEPTEPTEPTVPTEPTEPTQPTQPQGSTPPGIGDVGGNDPGGKVFDWSRLKPMLYGLLAVTLLCAVLVGQWQLRLALRRKRMAGGEFVHIHRRWRYACQLAKLCGHKEPKPLLELVKKAKFSRNGLNDRELRQFDRYCDACIRGLRKAPWYQRLALRLILAAW